ncbi:hypothetical protein EAE99_009427 [Botrytis elliptica]|nr:hypothetical protein EAE99_009427 [Botrytis elliptica]
MVHDIEGGIVLLQPVLVISTPTPQPLRAAEYLHNLQHPWQDQHGEDPPNSITQSTISGQPSLLNEGIERRYALSQRLEHLAMKQSSPSPCLLHAQGEQKDPRPAHLTIPRYEETNIRCSEIKPMQSNRIPQLRDPSPSRCETANAWLYKLEAWK